MSTHSNTPREDAFQKRRLNKCVVHGCKDRRLCSEFNRQGGLFFICQGHWLVLALMERDLAKAGFR